MKDRQRNEHSEKNGQFVSKGEGGAKSDEREKLAQTYDSDNAKGKAKHGTL